MKRRTRAIGALAAITVAVIGAAVTPAAATWTMQGPGPGAAQAGQLQAPSAAPVTVSSAGAHLTWTAPSTGSVPSGYVVSRNGATICTTTGTACDDTNLAPGTTYTYLVRSTAGLYWVSATPLTESVTTSSGGFALTALSPATVTAGIGLTFTVSATYGTGVTDPAYTGTTHPLTITSSVPRSPGGTSSGGQVTPPFVAGVATKVATTVYGSGTQTLTVSDGSRSGSVALTVSPATAATLELINATTNAVVCAPNGHVSIAAGGQLTARVAVVDAYGNLAVVSSALTTPLSYTGTGTLTKTSVSVPVNSSVSSQSFGLTMPTGTLKPGTLTITGQGTIGSTHCTVN